MTTDDMAAEVLRHLRNDPGGYTEEELRGLHRSLDAALLIVLRAIAEVTDKP
mgnify:CR=1 FL=1